MPRAEAPVSVSRKIPIREFTGGLNNAVDITSMADNQLARLENLEVDVNGALTSRPPIVRVRSSPQHLDIIGYFTDVNSVQHLVVSREAGTYLYTPATDTYLQITTVRASGAAQAGNKLYICSATESGGYWDGATFTKLDTGDFKMPRGEQIVLYKSRFWMISREPGTNRSRIYFSRITSAGTAPTSINQWNVWLATGNDYFDVSAGDGQWITLLLPGPSELYIFRSRSTYYFKYDSTPLGGRLDLLDGSIGADNRYSVARYEFSYLVLNAGRLYRFVSYNYYPLNDPQTLILLPAGGADALALKSAVSIFGRRALVWYGGVMYALDLSNNTWSTWSSTSQLAYVLPTPRSEGDLSPDTVYGISASNDPTKWGIYRIRDAFSADAREEMVCLMQTKALAFDAPDSWKRMFYWSADVMVAGDRGIRGIAEPQQLSNSVPTWDDMEKLTWDQLEEGTWDAILEKTTAVITDLEFNAGAPYRVNATFQRDQRFRRISFTLRMECDGSTATAPVRVSGLTAHVVAKQRLPSVVQ